MSENVFDREWRECLEAHYMHVVRTDDRVTLPSLTYVMHQAGFDDAHLAELRVRATMHVDNVGADFVPDMNVLEAAPQGGEARVFAVPGGVPSTVDEPNSPQWDDGEQATDVELTPEDELDSEMTLSAQEVELIPHEDELLREAEVIEEDETPPDDLDAPQQLSLF